MIQRRKLDRARQVYAWMADTFPTPYPTTLSLIRPKNNAEKKLCGWVVLSNRKLKISVNVGYPKYVVIDTLLHEMAHCVTWSHKSMENYIPDHSAQWGMCYAQIYRAFNDEGGWRDSGTY